MLVINFSCPERAALSPMTTGFSGGGMQGGTFGAAVVRAPQIGPARAP
jgi:hypothetical protein